jgi:hypothetical protein
LPILDTVGRRESAQPIDAGLNDILIVAALLSFAGAALALWLVREREIERHPIEVERTPELEGGRAQLVPAQVGERARGHAAR